MKINSFTSFPTTPGGKRVPNPIVWPASQMGTQSNEVNPTHRQRRKVLATREQSTATVKGVEDGAKSECRPVMGRIGSMTCGENRQTCPGCDSVKPPRL